MTEILISEPGYDSLSTLLEKEENQFYFLFLMKLFLCLFTAADDL